MGLEKAIEHKKEYRKPYRGAKAVDCTCRNNGTCEWCKNNRLYSSNKKTEAMLKDLKDYGKRGQV